VNLQFVKRKKRTNKKKAHLIFWTGLAGGIRVLNRDPQPRTLFLVGTPKSTGGQAVFLVAAPLAALPAPPSQLEPSRVRRSAKGNKVRRLGIGGAAKFGACGAIFLFRGGIFLFFLVGFGAIW
jgi:hypothetical protein